jgi:hypothetical protein
MTGSSVSQALEDRVERWIQAQEAAADNAPEWPGVSARQVALAFPELSYDTAFSLLKRLENHGRAKRVARWRLKKARTEAYTHSTRADHRSKSRRLRLHITRHTQPSPNEEDES